MILPSDFTSRVAEKASLREHEAKRQLIFFLHRLAFSPGGFEKVAADLVEYFPHRVRDHIRRFETIIDRKCAEQIAGSYGLDQTLQSLCIDNLEGYNCGAQVMRGDIWEIIAEYRKGYIGSVMDGFNHTSLSTAVFENLDRALRSTAFGAPLLCIEGEVSSGKSTAAKKWADAHPGESCYVNLRCSSKSKFFENLATELGIHVSGNATACGRNQTKVEQFLLNWRGLVIFDNSHLLVLSKTNKVLTQPVLIQWILAMQDRGVGFAFVASRQFSERLKATQTDTAWEGEQLISRIGHYVKLPSLSLADFESVTRTYLPDAPKHAIGAIAAYAKSRNFLTAIKTAVATAQQIAESNGRSAPSLDDIDAATDELGASLTASARLEVKKTAVKAPEQASQTRTAAPAREVAPANHFPNRGMLLPAVEHKRNARGLSDAEIIRRLNAEAEEDTLHI